MSWRVVDCPQRVRADAAESPSCFSLVCRSGLAACRQRRGVFRGRRCLLAMPSAGESRLRSRDVTWLRVALTDCTQSIRLWFRRGHGGFWKRPHPRPMSPRWFPCKSHDLTPCPTRRNAAGQERPLRIPRLGNPCSGSAGLCRPSLFHRSRNSVSGRQGALVTARQSPGSPDHPHTLWLAASRLLARGMSPARGTPGGDSWSDGPMYGSRSSAQAHGNPAFACFSLCERWTIIASVGPAHTPVAAWSWQWVGPAPCPYILCAAIAIPAEYPPHCRLPHIAGRSSHFRAAVRTYARGSLHL